MCRHFVFKHRSEMITKLRSQSAMLVDLPRQSRIISDGFRNRCIAFAVQFVVSKGCQFFVGDAQASKASRPRTRREFKVPTGQPTISAASL